ncbi:WhiB family transcriptional regulator [Actinacidiphila sp. bgisy144]|uniref:WhiB family transcriptional regulator n=1 Tax=Actinacidiphila sp. bgisy144 TaxID=3413791 RepID=UPI003EBD08E2
MRHITTNSTSTPALRGIADHSWHARAACRGLDPTTAERLFFPAPRARGDIAQAKRICATCPVKQACFDYALDTESRRGMWGGLTETERRPWHAKVAKRLDYNRVKAAFQGRDIHLSPAERDAVTRHAYTRGWTAERLAYALRLDLLWARDLMRNAAHDVADRDRYWGLTEGADLNDEEEELAPGADPEEEALDDDAATPGGVTRHVHTAALIAALRKAA